MEGSEKQKLYIIYGAVALAAVAGIWAFVYFYLEIKSIKDLVDFIAKAPVNIMEGAINLFSYFIQSFIMRLTGSFTRLGNNIAGIF